MGQKKVQIKHDCECDYLAKPVQEVKPVFLGLFFIPEWVWKGLRGDNAEDTESLKPTKQNEWQWKGRQMEKSGTKACLPPPLAGQWLFSTWVDAFTPLISVRFRLTPASRSRCWSVLLWRPVNSTNTSWPQLSAGIQHTEEETLAITCHLRTESLPAEIQITKIGLKPLEGEPFACVN